MKNLRDTRALGMSWRSISSRFGPNEKAKRATPVTLPPGRLRLATRPALTGSPPLKVTISIVGRFLRCHWQATGGRDHVPDGPPAPPPTLPFDRSPAVFDRYILALDTAGFI
jgi:hypothetical protein